ncbi:hypothetical protein ACFV2N_15320 [Streptomyces sp. NPDC059680]|uniref:hypothetical protein n=1 Tax=Streptomyces sp. NPDC059680 TaxID=3346904 RepID=UPI00369937FC
MMARANVAQRTLAATLGLNRQPAIGETAERRYLKEQYSFVRRFVAATLGITLRDNNHARRNDSSAPEVASTSERRTAPEANDPALISQWGRLLSGTRRNLVGAGLGALMVAILGTVVTLSATNSAMPPTGRLAQTGQGAPDVNKKNYKLVRDPNGFSLYVPRSFDRAASAKYSIYASKSKSQQIEIKSAPAGGSTPFKEIQRLEESASRDLGYERIRLDRFDNTPKAATELEYYTKGSTGLRHTVAFSSMGPDSRIYTVMMAGPEESWHDSYSDFRIAVSSLCVGYTCAND